MSICRFSRRVLNDRRGALQGIASEKAQPSGPGRRAALRQPLFTFFAATMLAMVAVWIFLAASVVIQDEKVTLPAVAGTIPGVNPAYLFSIEGIDRPLSVAVSNDGDRVYASESQAGRLIRVYDAKGKPITSFPLATGSQTLSPLYIAISQDGRLYVTDSGHQGIHIFSKDGKYLGDFQPGMDMQGGWAPLGLSFDKYGDLLVTDVTPGRHRVLLFDHDGKLRFQIGKQGNGPGEFQYPNSAVRAEDGYVFVADSNNGRIQAFDISGKPVAAEPSLTQFDNGGLPRGLAVDYNGHLFASDTTNNLVMVYRLTNGGIVRESEITGSGTTPTGFSLPNGIAISPQNRLFIADRGSNRVVVMQVESGTDAAD